MGMLTRCPRMNAANEGGQAFETLDRFKYGLFLSRQLTLHKGKFLSFIHCAGDDKGSVHVQRELRVAMAGINDARSLSVASTWLYQNVLNPSLSL